MFPLNVKLSLAHDPSDTIPLALTRLPNTVSIVAQSNRGGDSARYANTSSLFWGRWIQLGARGRGGRRRWNVGWHLVRTFDDLAFYDAVLLA